MARFFVPSHTNNMQEEKMNKPSLLKQEIVRQGRVQADVAREADGILVAESDQGEVIGYITSWQDAEAGIGYIPILAFVPEWRGRGLGRLLIQMILDRFRDSGLSHAKIETLANNEVGHHLYTSIGFHEVTRQAHFFADLDQAQSAHESASESSNKGDGP